jgi:hypothetical protein
MGHLPHKALLMVRPVERVLVTRAARVCRVSHSAAASDRTTVAQVARINPLSSAVAYTTFYQGATLESKVQSGEMQLIARVCLAFDDVANRAIPRRLERSSADRVPYGFDIASMSTCPVGQQS